MPPVGHLTPAHEIASRLLVGDEPPDHDTIFAQSTRRHATKPARPFRYLSVIRDWASRAIGPPTRVRRDAGRDIATTSKCTFPSIRRTRNDSSPSSGCPDRVPYPKPNTSGSSVTYTTRHGATIVQPGTPSVTSTVAPSRIGASGGTTWAPAPRCAAQSRSPVTARPHVSSSAPSTTERRSTRYSGGASLRVMPSAEYK